LVAEEHISLLWSEAVFFAKVSIDISPLCGEGDFCKIRDTTLVVEAFP